VVRQDRMFPRSPDTPDREVRIRSPWIRSSGCNRHLRTRGAFMKVGVLKEAVGPERRVALVPESVAKLAADGMSVLVQSGAGLEAGFSDSQYTDAGADLSADRSTVLRDTDL